MEAKKAGTSLESLMSSFNTRILELQDLVIARNSQSFLLFLIHFFVQSRMLMFSIVFSVPGYEHHRFIGGGRRIEGHGASAPLYQGPLAR